MEFLETKTIGYSNKNYRKSYNNLLNVNKYKISELNNEDNSTNKKGQKSYQTGYMISIF